jgi:hypothetical protein
VLIQRHGRQSQGGALGRVNARGLFDVEAARAVDQNIDRHVLALFEHPDEDLAQAPIDVPVDGAQIVAGDIGFEVRELRALTARIGALFGQTPALLRPRDPQGEGLEPRQEAGIEQGLEAQRFGQVFDR